MVDHLGSSIGQIIDVVVGRSLGAVSYGYGSPGYVVSAILQPRFRGPHDDWEASSKALSVSLEATSQILS